MWVSAASSSAASCQSSGATSGEANDTDCRAYVNLLKRWGRVVRITIWSENGGIDKGTGQDWVGKHVSATGLIGQPFISDAFLVPRTDVGIVLEDPRQLNFVSADEAKRRLVPPAHDPVVNLRPIAAQPYLSNRHLVLRLMARNKRRRKPLPRGRPTQKLRMEEFRRAQIWLSSISFTVCRRHRCSSTFERRPQRRRPALNRAAAWYRQWSSACESGVPSCRHRMPLSPRLYVYSTAFPARSFFGAASQTGCLKIRLL